MVRIESCRKDRKSRDILADCIQEASIPSKLPVTRKKNPLSENIVDRVRSDVSPIVSVALLTVSQVGKARTGIVLAVVTPPILQECLGMIAV
jgi:hypothetical protein